jgi:hypothetical protein
MERCCVYQDLHLFEKTNIYCSRTSAALLRLLSHSIGFRACSGFNLLVSQSFGAAAASPPVSPCFVPATPPLPATRGARQTV